MISVGDKAKRGTKARQSHGERLLICSRERLVCVVTVLGKNRNFFTGPQVRTGDVYSRIIPEEMVGEVINT